MVYVNIKPGRMLFFACMLALSGAMLINGAIYHSPLPHPLWFAVAMGIGVELVAAWIAVTAVWWWCRMAAITMRGPRDG